MFHQAVCEGDVTKVKFLLKYARGIQIDRPNKNGLTALQQSCLDGKLELVNFLLEKGADLSLVDSEGKTALHFAALGGDLSTVSLLVNSSCADVNAKSATGQTPLDMTDVPEIQALLSQAVVTDEIKQKNLFRSTSSSEDWDLSCYYKQNYPGSRYSISSTSTDSGVSEDYMTSSGNESSLDQRFISYHKPLKPFTDNSFYTRNEILNTEDLNAPRERYEDSYRFARKSAYTSPLRQNSFTNLSHLEEEKSTKRNTTTGDEHNYPSGTDKPPQYKRTHKPHIKDPSRRRTVTFGEIEYEGISPRGSDASQIKTFSLRRQPINIKQPLLPNLSKSPLYMQTRDNGIAKNSEIDSNLEQRKGDFLNRSCSSLRDKSPEKLLSSQV